MIFCLIRWSLTIPSNGEFDYPCLFHLALAGFDFGGDGEEDVFQFNRHFAIPEDAVALA